MPISVATPPEARGLRAAALRSLVRQALRVAAARPGEIGVVLADDARLRELNRRWRGLDRATDVLSFPYETAPGRTRRVSGDIVVSLERVREQAGRFRVSFGAELARVVIHGALHLAGLDHHRVAERRAMRALEEKALAASRLAIRGLNGRPRAARARSTAPRRRRAR